METGPTGKTYLLLVATLVARLAKKLAVLLLRHALAPLLDDGTHVYLTVKSNGRANREPEAKCLGVV